MREGEGCICGGFDEREPYPYPCPECGSLTYLGIFIPTAECQECGKEGD